jgi:polysaccharide pyruvyl transferase WcaK-like protein
VGRRAAYHVGDDAMLQGLIETVRQGPVPVQWTVMSADPPRSAAEWGVCATARLTFEDCAGPVEREARLAALDRVLQTAPARWSSSAPASWREPLAAIAECDGVVVAGGGNLSRSWPGEVFERTAVARAAQRAGRPVAITSQTIGPYFDERTRELTSALLRAGVLVGLREASSYDLALALGAPRDRTVLQFDDATGVPPTEPPWWREVAGDHQFIAVTLNQIGDLAAAQGSVALLARQLGEVSRSTGATVVLVPHVGDLHGAPAHDVAMAQAVAAAAGDWLPLRICPLPTPPQAVWIAARAQLVVSTRYHPLVFATATTTPSLFLHQDRYTFVKGTGGMNLVGLASWTLPVAAAAAGLLVPAVLELWTRRHEVREHLQHVAPAMETRRHRHAADLLAVLASPQSWSAGEPMAASSGPAAAGDWVEQAHDSTAILEAADASIRTIEQQLAGAEACVHALTREVERKEADLVIAQAGLADLTKATQEAHAAWQTDRQSLLRHCELLEQRASTAEQWAGVLASEIERKEADLLIAMATPEEIPSQRNHERAVPPAGEPEPSAPPRHQS